MEILFYELVNLNFTHLVTWYLVRGILEATYIESEWHHMIQEDMFICLALALVDYTWLGAAL